MANMAQYDAAMVRIDLVNDLVVGLDMILDVCEDMESVLDGDVRDHLLYSAGMADRRNRWDLGGRLSWLARNLNRYGSLQGLKDEALQIRNDIVGAVDRPPMPGPDYVWHGIGRRWVTRDQRRRSFQACGI